MDADSVKGPVDRARRALGSRWDQAAVQRAELVFDRGRRGTDQGTSALSHSMLSQFLAVVQNPEQWTPSERAQFEYLLSSLLRRVGDGSLRPARSLTDELSAALLASVKPPDEGGAVGAIPQSVVLAVLKQLAGGTTTPPDDVVAAVCAAFEALYHPTGDDAANPPAVVRTTIIDQFHRFYYHNRPRAWERTEYRGHRILKLPLDLWMYQVILDLVKPGLVIETGTRYGGSALWLGDQLDRIGHGRVVSIDIDDFEGKPAHSRVDYLVGSSTDPAIIEQIQAMLPSDGSGVVVMLDSDHSRDHVLAEMQLLGPMVTPGSYLIVEDTNINGHPVYEEFGPGPAEAVTDFLAEHSEFEIDGAKEIFYFTMHPHGFLRRKAAVDEASAETAASSES